MASNFKVRYIYIALDEGSDYYRIYGEKDGTTKGYHHDIAFDELGDVLDSMIETGGMTKEEYQAKVKDFVCSVSIDFLKQLNCITKVIHTQCFKTFCLAPVLRHFSCKTSENAQGRHLNINELQKMVEWYKIHLSPQTRV